MTTTRRSGRSAIADQMRKDQARRERRRNWAYIGAIVIVVLGLLAASVVPYVRDRQQAERLRNVNLDAIGVSPAAAACRPRIVTDYQVPAEGNHVPNGTSLSYEQAPPAFGRHWAAPLDPAEYRSYFTSQDRPAKELLVHSLEHGYTVIWYDGSLASGDPEVELKAISGKFQPEDRVIVAPWMPSDGDAFPDGAHIALTHWTGPKAQRGVWEYCRGVSGEAVAEFVKDYPLTDAPEPRA